MIDDSGWSESVKEWLVDTGYCNAGGLASAEDGVVYAAAYGENSGDEAAFAYLYKDDHDEEIITGDGDTTTVVTINEATTILQAVNEGKCPQGVWIGGTKFKFIGKEANFEYNDSSFDCASLARSKGGGTIVKTAGGTLVIALYDEDLEQNKGNCRTTALAYAEYLDSQGY